MAVYILQKKLKNKLTMKYKSFINLKPTNMNLSTLLILYALIYINGVKSIISNFDLSGTAFSTSAKQDWANVLSTTDPTQRIISTGLIVDPAPQGIFTGGGSKDTNDISRWRYTDGSVPDKNELSHAFAYADVFNGDLLVFFGSDRFSNDGDSAIGFWFFQDNVQLSGGQFTGHHKNGDVLIIGNYGSTQEIQVYRWENGDLVLSLNNAQAECNDQDQVVCAITNNQVINSPWNYTSKSGLVNKFPELSFLEGGLNLKDIFPGESVPCFTSFLAVSRSSSSVNAQLKDFVLGSFDICKLDIDLQCTNVTLNQAHNGLTYEYKITVENSGFGTIYDVDVFYNNINVAHYDQLLVNDQEMITGTFGSNNLDQSAGPASVTGSKVLNPVVSSDFINKVATSAQCPMIQVNPALYVNGTCRVELEKINNYLVVHVYFNGQVCNTGDIELSGVTLMDDYLPTMLNIGTLGFDTCSPYQGNFFPMSGIMYTDTIDAMGQSTLGNVGAQASVTFECQLCPACQ